jgi:hypothetical protein
MKSEFTPASATDPTRHKGTQSNTTATESSLPFQLVILEGIHISSSKEFPGYARTELRGSLQK